MKAKNIHIKIFLLLFLSSFLLTFSPLQAQASAITETNVFNLTNKERSKYSVAGVSWNYKLATAARNKAQDMINRDYFSHNTPDGKTPWTFITAAGYNYIYAGENLAMNYTVAEDMMAAWMASGGHRANILSTNFKELGVGVVTGEFQGYSTIMVVQMFGTSATAVYDKAEKSPAPVKKAPQKKQAVIPATVDHTKVINLSSEFVKKRIKDFSQAFTKFKNLFTDT